MFETPKGFESLSSRYLFVVEEGDVVGCPEGRTIHMDLKDKTWGVLQLLLLTLKYGDLRHTDRITLSP